MNYYFKKGDCSLILLSVHDGDKKFQDCDNRHIKKIGEFDNYFVDKNDINTKLITLNTYNLMKNRIKPYLLINNVHRSHVDLNRNIKKACNDKCGSCKTYYESFHNKLEKTVNEIKKKYGKCFILDIHGNMHSKNMIQLGYNVQINDIKNNKFNELSLNSLKDNNYQEIKKHLYGTKSLSYFFNKNAHKSKIDVYPVYNNINSEILKNKRYYYGRQYLINKYGKICDIVLLELSPDVRFRYNTSNIISNTMVKYITNIYNNINRCTNNDKK